jgi:hypothetical protein
MAFVVGGRLAGPGRTKNPALNQQLVPHKQSTNKRTPRRALLVPYKSGVLFGCVVACYEQMRVQKKRLPAGGAENLEFLSAGA